MLGTYPAISYQLTFFLLLSLSSLLLPTYLLRLLHVNTYFSFDTDTGLKQALATVNDYNPLMKDFPINDLLSATELDRIRSAVQVLVHFRKIS